jgi:hypothetical protein
MPARTQPTGVENRAVPPKRTRRFLSGCRHGETKKLGMGVDLILYLLYFLHIFSRFSFLLTLGGRKILVLVAHDLGPRSQDYNDESYASLGFYKCLQSVFE